MNIYYTSQFKKDYKKIKFDEDRVKELKIVIDSSIISKNTDQKYFDHKLIGEWDKHRECHFRPDLILIYRKNKEELILERIG